MRGGRIPQAQIYLRRLRFRLGVVERVLAGVGAGAGSRSLGRLDAR